MPSFRVREKTSTMRRIELTAGATLELGQRLIGGAGFPVGAIVGHRRVGVADGDDSRGKRNLVAVDAVGIAGSVPAFVRRADDSADLAQCR